MTRSLLVGNWKMNCGPGEARSLAQSVKEVATSLKQTSVWITPPLISIPAVAEIVRGTDIRLGSQNVHWAPSGAFTGEVSVQMLQEEACTFALVGHSERRAVFGETPNLVAQRALGALKSDFTTVFCVGETLKEREDGRTKEVLRSQFLPFCVASLSASMADRVVIAYEPVWAIGTGKVATASQIEDAVQDVSSLWKELTPHALPRILYGGSVDPLNCKSILEVKGVGGCLIGGASINIQKLKEIITVAESLVTVLQPHSVSVQNLT